MNNGVPVCVQVTPYLKPEDVTARLEDGCYITGMVSLNSHVCLSVKIHLCGMMGLDPFVLLLAACVGCNEDSFTFAYPRLEGCQDM
jgi:hypothetical protein